MKAHNIDVSRMLSTNRLDKVILEVERKLRMKRRTHKNNIKSIVEKLLKEYKEKRLVQKKIIKQRRLERVEKGGIFHLKGRVNSLNFISSVHMPHAREDKILKEFMEAGVCLKEEPISKIVPTNENSSEESPHSIGASIEEEDFEDGPLELPNEDGKYKIYLDDSAHKKLGIFKTFVEFENTLEARHFLCLCEKERKEKERMEFDYPDDTAFIIKPNQLKFQNFGKGKIYKKQMALINMSGCGVKIRLLKIYTEDPTQSIYFELETDEMKVALPGLPIKYTLIFKPHDNMNITVGWMVFLICNKSKYYRRIVPIECIPTVFQVAIEPLHLTFGTIPIWKFQKKHKDFSRTIKVKSSGSSYYKIIMKKMIDPFELISVSTEEEYDDLIYDAITEEVPKSQAVLDVEAILLDIIQEVESDFRIDKRFLQVNRYSADQKIEVSLSADKYPGFFIEKYQFDIYEVNGTNDDYKGMQEITLILEVSDYPIKCDPICVDFGICFLDVAYQTKFNLTNISNITQPVSVKVPSTLSYYISTDEKAAYIRAEEIREITLKFLPSYDFLTDKNKYYDPSTDILCFPIQIKLLNKQYADAPPLIQQAFAILCNCSDLKVGPVFAHHYSLIDENMVLDLGECFVNEAVVTQLVLKNPCCTTIYYCFKNLPPYMTIMPNYGIGSIEACQQIDLKLFIHPTLDDFERAGMDSHIFSEVKQFKISVATMDKVGKYRRKPDQSRLVNILKLMLQQLRKIEDTSLLEEICFARCLWRVKMIPCSCESAIERATANDEIQQEVFQSNFHDFTNFENYGIQQPVISPVTEATFATIVEDFSDSSSKSSRTGMKQEDNAKTTNQAVKKKKRKTSKRKTHESGNILTLSPFLDESGDRPGNTEIPPSSPENPLLIPTNSETNFAENLTSSLFIKTTFIKPLYEFSFNHIEFPATPGASFSTMTTELRPLKFLDKSCICGFEPVQEKPKYRATFRIAGSTEEIRIEPTYGTLEYGESRLITVVATPKINDDVVAGYAFDRKRSALLKEKILQAEQNRKQKAKARKKNKTKTKTKNKTKKVKSPRSKKSTEEDQQEAESPLPTVLSEEVQVGILDFYPAEIAIWRNIEPYFLNVNFVCHVEYDFEEFWYHPPDVFSLETVCKVIPPDFIHDQKSQHLDFGQVAIGESRKKIITVQNIKYNDITVRTSILRPHGNFTCPNFDPVQLPSESFLRIPITYTATQEENATLQKTTRPPYTFI
ncbi:hypothetical protein WA026_002476 [Henosepilachna vigintioctopunctata]|uniref:MSP domain-containing protein n=1 Tax=Henosepilachna vigintioctopunctata TaxID=420089 RepID=A0AAW1TZJ5_9CUCU